MQILRVYLEIGLRFNRCGFYEGVDKIKRNVLGVSLEIPFYFDVSWDNTITITA
jgi:hypothetical protein